MNDTAEAKSQNGEQASETSDIIAAPAKLSLQARAERTDVIAREIMAAELDEREKKTARLRELRLAQESAAPEPVKKPRARKSRSKKPA